MQDLRERMTQALYSAAPNIGEAVMEYVDEQQGIIDTLLDEIQARDESERDLQAHLAAMREALEYITRKNKDIPNHVAAYTFATATSALAPDAGKKLLERLAKAEAERVTSLNRELLWQYVFVNTGVGVDELDGIIEYLILNDHIREAE